MIAYYSLLLRKKRESNGYNGDNHPKGVQHEDAEVVHLRGLKKTAAQGGGIHCTPRVEPFSIPLSIRVSIQNAFMCPGSPTDRTRAIVLPVLMRPLAKNTRVGVGEHLAVPLRGGS